MWDFNLMTALQSVEKTMGFVLQRWLVFLALAAGFLVATVAGAGSAIGMGSLSDNPLVFAHLGALTGFIAFSWAAYKTRRLLFRSIRVPHLYLLTQLSSTRSSLPEGKAQVEFARRSAAEHLPEPATLWEMREVGRAALIDWSAHRHDSETASKSPWYAVLANRLSAWLGAANVDLMLSQIIRAPSANSWQSAHNGLLVLVKNSSMLHKNRLWLTAFEGLGWFLSFLLLLVAFRKITDVLPFPTGYWPNVFAFLFAWKIKATFLEPTAQAALLQLRLEPATPPESEHLAEILTAKSAAFRTMTERASGIKP